MKKIKTDTPPTLSYYAFILFSVLDILGLAFCILGIIKGAANKLNPITPGFGQQVSSFGNIGLVLSFIGAALCVILYPLIKIKRQTLRDLVEYDSDGMPRSRGRFSQLSSEERKKIEAQTMMEREKILPSTIVKSITRQTFMDPDGELSKLTGLSAVKDEIKQMEARMKYERMKQGKKQKRIKSSFPMHMVFLGRPGTGKSTVARIAVSYLYKYGFIEKPQYFEIDGNFFNGLSTGEATKRADMLIKLARGSCIFIDEAYALLSSGTQEAIATIVKAMEDRDTVFIFAGYEKEMEGFLRSNSGIESRIKYQFHFADYNDFELREILIRMAGDHGLVIDAEFAERAVLEIGAHKKDPGYGNARDVRTYLDRSIDRHAYNLETNQVAGSDRYKLTIKDIPT